MARSVPPDRVIIVDQLTVPSANCEEWLALWRSGYVPHAEERGLQLRGVWKGIGDSSDHVVLMIWWSLDRVGRYWSARWAATDDPSVTDFWKRTDALVHSRERRVLESQSLPT
jgi:hypothetical protein